MIIEVPRLEIGDIVKANESSWVLKHRNIVPGDIFEVIEIEPCEYEAGDEEKDNDSSDYVISQLVKVRSHSKAITVSEINSSYFTKVS